MTASWVLAAALAAAADRPNVLVISCEDAGPHLGCYGDTDAATPHLDALAARGLRYTAAWSNCPVCAPARTALISGLYPSATGSEHMRSLVPVPAGMKMYPGHLRDAGYYCTNNAKEDYNLVKPAGTWDESSAKAHYKNRPAGRPFFAVFNLTVSHESQVRARPHTPVHDPAKVRVPAYMPDTPEARRDWAQYHDKVSEMDRQAGRLLGELAAAGLADDTVVVFFADHGAGLPRNKRSACNSGLHVPLLVHVPETWKRLAPPEYKPGGVTDRPVSFVDVGPSVLSLAGVKPPAAMQGVAFLGPHAGPPREYLYGVRGRMDERIDLVRSVRWRQYVYVRNYLPHLPAGQHVGYMFEMPTTRAWKALYDAGKLPPEQAAYWRVPRPPEELYDLTADPDEVRNLAGSAEHRPVLERLRAEARAQAVRVRDVGLLPEAEMHRRSAGASPYDTAREMGKYPVERVLAAAELASMPADGDLPKLRALLADDDAGVRYWAVTGHLIRGEAAVSEAKAELRALLADEAAAVRVAAAGALADRDVLLAHADPKRHGAYAAVQALNAIDNLGDAAAALRPALAKLPLKDPKAPARANEYVDRLVKHILKRE